MPLIPPGLSVVQVLPAPDRVTIVAEPRSTTGTCPDCGTPSRTVHSRYERDLSDLPWQGRPVTLRIKARRFRCIDPACARRTFADRLPEVAAVAAHRTKRLGGLHDCLGLALGGEAGARLAARLAISTSPDTLLRAARSGGGDVPESPTPRVLGVDDWSWRRGHRYGTILVDLERNKVVELLPDRQAETLAAWLKGHPGVEIIARDRAGAYADGARQGAPDAVQVSDRWHLLRNLGEALQGVVDRHRSAVRQAARAVGGEVAASAPPSPPSATRDERRRAERREHRRLCYEEMVRLQRLGLPGHAIGRAVGVSALTVYRWLKAGGPPTHDKPEQHRSITPHEAFLDRRWAEGCRNGARLWRELRAQGYKGAERNVVRWATRQRRRERSETDAVRRAALWSPPSNRRCARLLGTTPDQLDAQERSFLVHLAEFAPDVIHAGEIAEGFAMLLRERQPDATQAGAALVAWMAIARETALGSFARGLERDTKAIVAAMTTPWSTSPVEGQINRLKTIKRSMYGRAGFNLLRARVLQTT